MAPIKVILVAITVTVGKIEVVIMVTRGLIEVMMIADVDICLNRPSILPLSIRKKLLMVIVEVDIGPITDDLPTITHVTMVYCCVYLLIIARR